MAGLEALEKMEYPGRGIVMGESFVAYFVTGRSANSQARRIDRISGGNLVFVDATNRELVEAANVDLLLYNAIAWTDDFVAVSNGKQTGTLYTQLSSRPADAAEDIISDVAGMWRHEPDPSKTPRVLGCRKGQEAYLAILKSGEVGSVDRQIFRHHGGCRCITTYAGDPNNPLPAFEGGPVELEISGSGAEIADSLWGALDDRYRVSLAVLEDNQVYTRNRADGE